jgi:hypothetical protein
VRFVVALTMMFAALAAGAPASAGGGGSKAKKPKAEATVPEGPRVPSVYMPTLVAPMIVGGELHHYMFLSVTLELTSDNHKSMMLERIPYIQDAFLREVHGASIAKDNDPTVLDEAGLKARLLAVSKKVVGENIVQNVALRDAALAQH